MRSKQPPGKHEGQAASREGRILIVSLSVGGAALLTIIVWYYLQQRKAIESSAANQVIAIAKIQVEQIENWRNERLGDGQMLEVPAVQHMARDILLGRNVQPFEGTDLVNVMRGMEHEFLYTGAALVDRDGNIDLQSNSAPSDPARIAELGRAAAASTNVALGDLYWDDNLRRPLMALSIPVHGLGAFIFTIDPGRFLYPFLTAWPVPSATGETILVRREGDRLLALSDTRFTRGAALRLSRSGLEADLRSLHTKFGWTGQWRDYRDKEVIGTMLPVPDSPWLVVAKIDLAEVDAPIRRLGWEIVLIVALLVAANAAAVALVWRGQQMRIYRQREAWLQQMADETPALLWTTAEDGTAMFINKSLAEFIGGSQKQTLRGTWKSYIHPDDVDRVAKSFYGCVATGAEFNEEHRLRRFDGEYRWVLARGLPRPSDNGPYFHFAGSMLDITERKRAEIEIKNLSARLINAQEEERTRLARELHDDLGQQIAALSLAVGNLKRGIPVDLSEARAQSERIREKLIHLANATRRLSHELHPAVLQHCGLEVALRAFCSEFGALAGIEVSFSSSGAFDCLAPSVALCAFRVAQEALQNVAKHAGTRTAAVSLERTREILTLAVSDEGRGMDLKTCGQGLGLTSIKERARLASGTVEIHSRPQHGTSVILRLPCPPEAFSDHEEHQDRASRELAS